MDQIHFLEECSHIIWKECLKFIVENELGKNGIISCPNWEGPISDFEIKWVLGEEFYNELQEKAIENLIEEGKYFSFSQTKMFIYFKFLELFIVRWFVG